MSLQEFGVPKFVAPNVAEVAEQLAQWILLTLGFLD